MNPSPAPNGHRKTTRTAREVIDAAIQENLSWERVCLALTTLFAGSGVAVGILGVVRDNGIISAAGSVMAALCWPALRFAAAIRRENLSLRMLEVPLSQAKTAAQAAEVIRDVFLSNFRKG